MGIVFIDVSPLHELSSELKLKDEAFTIAYILKILQSQDPAASSKNALGSIKKAAPSEITHFDPELVSPLSDIWQMERVLMR